MRPGPARPISATSELHPRDENLQASQTYRHIYLVKRIYLNLKKKDYLLYVSGVRDTKWKLWLQKTTASTSNPDQPDSKRHGGSIVEEC